MFILAFFTCKFVILYLILKLVSKGLMILRNISIIVLAIFFIYLGISTIFVDASVVGTVGKILGAENRNLFGYLGFIYPFALAIFMPFITKLRSFHLGTLEIILGSCLLFVATLMVQALLTSGVLQGFIGLSIIEMLEGFIGSIGIWLFILMIVALALVILIDFENFSLSKRLKLEKNLFSFSKKPEFWKKKEKEQVLAKNEEDELTQEQHENIPESLDNLVKELEEPKNPPFIVEEGVPDFDLKIEDNDKPSTSKKVEVLNEVEENKKLLADMEIGDREKPKDFKLPPLKFLKTPPPSSSKVSESEIDQKISDLLDKLRRFKIDGDVVRTYAGPVVTTFEFRPAPHIKVSKILTLQDDLAMALKAQTIRIQAPIPGKDVVGIEIPNKQIDTIYLKSILESKIFQKSSSPLTIALGKDIVGNPFVTDLKKLPHLLIAGTTGSGKSVGINSMLLSLLYRNSPQTLRLMMIDPKMLEFSIYNDIPHLLTPVITQSKEAVMALANMVNEMERRYQVMSQTKTKNIESYNDKAKKENLQSMPYIVIIIDELADLMMTSGKDVEFYISRIAQMARAAGIHLLVATQRPSVDVVTGLIKANLPSRISYRVGQKIDSKVILDGFGAESLLGRGDMLFTPPSSPGLIRLHAPFASEEEIDTVVEYLKTQGEPQYDQSFLKDPNADESSGEGNFDSNELDEFYEDAKKIVLSERKTSISYIQRRLQIGYNRSARIVEQLEKMGVLSPPNNKGQREIVG